MRGFLSFLSVVVFTGSLAFGQITGDLQINVADPSNAAIPNATVSVRNLGTGATRNLATDNTGAVRVSQLPVGSYEVKVTHDGFTTATAQAQVESGTIKTVPIVLGVAGTSQTVAVQELAEVINTVNPQLQTTLENTAITDLPLVGSGVLGVAALSPGITPVTPNNPFLGLGSYNSNGGRGRGNNITIDNATATDVSTTGGAEIGTVPLDAIKETNLITNQFSAEFGRNANSQFQILTRGGTNDFHGEMFEFARNSFFNARDYFDRTGKATPNINNDWGALAGGHIIRNKLFYFGTYEENTIRGLGGTRIAVVPTPAQAASASPIAQQILKQDQVPTSPSGTVSQVAPSATDTLAYSGRVDWVASSKDLFYARFGEQSSHALSTGNTFIDSNLANNGASSANRSWNGTLSETHTFGPTLVNTFLASYGRSAPVFAPLLKGGGPEIIFTDGTSNFGTWSGLPQGRIQNTYQYSDIAEKVWGRHQVKFGAEVDRIQANSFFDSNVNGSFTFTSLANFLAGNAYTYSQDFGNSVRGNRVWNEFFFVQDDWKVTRTLTLNIGFREEIAQGPTEINGVLSNINPGLTSTPLGGAGTGPLGSFYTGGSYFHTNYNPGPRFGFSWNPGGGKTVIRGGYGITYDFIYLNPITNGRFLPPFMYTFSIPPNQVVAPNTVQAILAGSSPFQQTGFGSVGSFGTTIKNFGNVTYVDPNLKNPQVQQMSLTVEHQFLNSWLIRAGYSGSLGHYLQRTRPLNFVRAGLFTPPTSIAQETANASMYQMIQAGETGSTTAGSNRIDPRFNAVSVVQSTANSNYNSFQFLAERRFADWYGFSVAYTWSKSIDDASDALGVLANDTSAQQDPNNNRNNRAVSQFDVPQRVVITHLFQSSSKFFSSKLLNTLLGGWQFDGVFQAQSGLPANILEASLTIPGTSVTLTDPLLLGGATGVVRPNLVGSSVNLQFSPTSGGVNPNKVTNSNLQAPLVGQFGSLGRNVVRLNPLIESDMSFGRVFKFAERISFQVQAQVYNVFNNTTFSSPGLNISAPSTFGYYTGTDTNSRRIAITGRLIW